MAAAAQGFQSFARLLASMVRAQIPLAMRQTHRAREAQPVAGSEPPHAMGWRSDGTEAKDTWRRGSEPGDLARNDLHSLSRRGGVERANLIATFPQKQGLAET